MEGIPLALDRQGNVADWRGFPLEECVAVGMFPQTHSASRMQRPLFSVFCCRVFPETAWDPLLLRSRHISSGPRGSG